MFNLRDAQQEVAKLRSRRSQLDADWGDGANSRLLSFYVKVMTRMVDAERCSIFISDPSTGKLWLKSGTGVGERAIEVGVEDSVVGRVVATGQPIVMHGLEQCAGAHKATDAATGFVTRSILSVPIRTLDGKRVAGAVEVLNKAGGAEFTVADRATLEETAHFLQHAIASIYYSQDAMDVLGRVTRFAAAAVTVAVICVFGLMGLLILYWIGSSMAGA